MKYSYFFRQALKFLQYYIAFFFILIGFWMEKKFGQPSFEQVLYHMQVGSENLIWSDKGLVISFCKRLGWALLLAALVVFPTTKQKQKFKAFWGGLFSSLLKRPLSNNTSSRNFKLQPFFGILLLIFSIVFFLHQISFWQYLFYQRHDEYNNFIDKHYVAPAKIKAPKEKKNLIIIYVESLENTYQDKNLFGHNLLSPLEKATHAWHHFPIYDQQAGTGWTMGGIFSSQCGVPLRPQVWYLKKNTRNNWRNEQGTFMPGITCLGDILKENGYKNIFIGGANLLFSGKGNFLKQHGYDERWGKLEYLDEGYTKEDMNNWGLYDDKVFKFAKQRLKALQASKQPFNLTILTVDTHQPDGFISPSCDKQGVKDFPGIVNCTAHLVSNFVNYVKKQGYDQNTNIVILGDHLVMTNPVYDIIQKEAHRTIYNKFYSVKPLTLNRDHILHFDIFPSIMVMLGFDFPNHQLGLGTSAFGQLITKSPLVDDEPNLTEKLTARSDIYGHFWQRENTHQ